MKTISLIQALGVSLLAVAAATAVRAADWPERPVTLVVPLAPGGSTDSTARLLAEKLGGELGQPVIVDNRAGAGGNIGAAYVAKSTPDGYTLLMHTSTVATNVTLYKSMGFDLQKDLIPVSQVALIPNVLMVNNQVPAKNLQEFIELVKQKKTPVNYGSAGNGTSQHLSGALFNSMAQGEMTHVPYKGGAPANADLLAGQIQAVFSPLVEVLPYIDSGKLRALGVTTKARLPRLPDVPAIAEALPGFEVVLWNGVFAPTGTPPAVVTRLNAAIRKVLQDPAMRKTLADQGSTPVGNSPAEFKQILGEEIVKWGKLVKLSGAAVD
ncbi:tripartite tricarboxylate transporter substrate binding protein [Xylophilus rhododendri]|uniref:Tripartite tricarboxylate transporter substrate binding protein n=1 Tax=Xylophilus rhododendri TaxID=2697032 RepID=A0A857J165_9BURK|nr:tripartite tricarboxylate transporter substrate binding protein [Xylophilus rhododendri]QHI96919.1 tripartite tricarboxylate transporter substrate binding protein [Xylophilus rhododendri]